MINQMFEQRTLELLLRLAVEGEKHPSVISDSFFKRHNVAQEEIEPLLKALAIILRGYFGVEDSTRCLIEVVGLSYGLINEQLLEEIMHGSKKKEGE